MCHNRTHLAVVYLLLLTVAGCTPSLEEKIASYQQAHNDHDIDKVMSMYTEDITFEVVGMFVKTGKDQVRGIAEWDLATNSKMIISDIQITGNSVTFNLKEGNDWFRLVGIEYMYYTPCSMVFDNGLIKSFKAEASAQSMEAFGQVWPPVYQWLTEEKKEEMSKLTTQEGAFIYNKENARAWISILNEWKNKN
jgi:hypothetical protein